MTDVARTAALTTLLADDPALRKLIVTWPLVAGAVEDRRTIVEWSAASGIPRSVAERAAVVLFRHSVCRPDHTVDPEASRIVAHFAAETLRAAQRSRR